jgi:hypothetical protein
MLGFNAISEAPISSLPISGVTTTASATISATGSVTSIAAQTISVASSMSASASMTEVGILELGAATLITSTGSTPSSGVVVIGGISSISGSASVSSTSTSGQTRFGQAHISTVGDFTQGFTKGFQTGSSLVGRHFISQNHIDAKATITAYAENITHHEASLSAIATLISEVCRFQSTASLTGNSVLLHGGTVNLRPIATLTSVISSDTENPDIIKITSYIDKSNSFTLYIDKQISITSYIDKGFSLSAYIDKTKSESVYIDKIVNKTLVRER